MRKRSLPLGYLSLQMSTKPDSADGCLSMLLILEVEVLDVGCLSKCWDITQLESPSSPHIMEKIVRKKPGSSSFGAYIFIRHTSSPSINPFIIINLPAESL